MPITVVLGAQWGDEGKGKIVDYFAQKSHMCVRFSGGDNAGHTVMSKSFDMAQDKEEFKLHLVPCGIFNSETLCVIGNGVAVNAHNLIKEIDELERRGISCRNLRISPKAHLIMPWHLVLDALQEEERGEDKIGTTKKGIGPVFSDKIARFGLRMEDLVSEDFELKLKRLHQRAIKIIWEVYGYKNSDLIYEHILNNLRIAEKRLQPFIVETEPIIWKACDEGKKILMEGAQGLMLDPDFGSYPNTTSSPCTLASALQGSGASWQYIKEVIGVVKAYTTRVCDESISFLTEMPKEIADQFRKKAKEYGATTGRPRRMGWLDASLLKYSARINGFTSLVITRMDTLGTFLPVYMVKIFDGEKYIEMPCDWNSDVKSLNAQNYLKMIENLAGVPIKYVSYGPGRDEIMVRRVHRKL